MKIIIHSVLMGIVEDISQTVADSEMEEDFQATCIIIYSATLNVIPCVCVYVFVCV